LVGFNKILLSYGKKNGILNFGKNVAAKYFDRTTNKKGISVDLSVINYVESPNIKRVSTSSKLPCFNVSKNNPIGI
jgi:hypothetical protein